MNHNMFTAVGLRAVMGAGYSKMNELTIIQTTQVSWTQQQFCVEAEHGVWLVALFSITQSAYNV